MERDRLVTVTREGYGVAEPHDDSKEYRRQLEREVERQTDARMAHNTFKSYSYFVVSLITIPQIKESIQFK